MATCPDRSLSPVNRNRVCGDDSPGSQVTWTSALISASGHVVPVRVLIPAQPSGWLVWAHGGSWSRGSAEHWHAPCAELAAWSSCVVVSVDYRLAPRHQHPAPVEDVLTAMRWTHQQMAQEGTDPALLAVGGDSAGGTLAACAALMWRDRGRPLAAQVLAYPPLDPCCDAASYSSTAGQFPDRSTMRLAWEAHLGGGATSTSRHSRYRTPLDADTLTGVAPGIVAVGDLDPVRDDVKSYVERLHRSNVQVVYRQFTNTAHGAFLLSDTRRPTNSADEPTDNMRAWLAYRLRNLLNSHPISPQEIHSTTGTR